MQVFIARVAVSYRSNRNKLDILMQDFMATEGGRVDHVGTAADGEVVTRETTLAVGMGLKDVVEDEVILRDFDERARVAEINEVFVFVDAGVDTTMVLTTVE